MIETHRAVFDLIQTVFQFVCFSTDALNSGQGVNAAEGFSWLVRG